MTLGKTFATAFEALRRNVMRAALTTLGIVIGVAAVITMMEVGNGSSTAIRKTIASMGSNNILIQPGTAASGGVSWGAGTVTTLTAEDADAILREAPSVKTGSPIVRLRTQAVRGGRNWVPQNIYGATPRYLEVRDWTSLAEGQEFTERDVRNSSKVCLIGKSIVRELFPGGESPIGKEIRLQNVSLTVIGVLRAKGANMMGMDQDDSIIVPWTTVKYRLSNTSSTNAPPNPANASTPADAARLKLYPSGQTPLYPQPSASQAADTPLPVRFANVNQIIVAARSAEEIPQAMDEITAILRERHRIREGEPDDFNNRDMTEMVKTVSQTSDLMTRLLLCVACISLMVGGVGIMNIMLVSVTERTREIGLRMAIGAKQRNILQQFLVEAVVLCLAGGAFGVIVGRGASWAIRTILQWPAETSIPAIIASVAVSATVGIVFGFYPAWRASRLDPIEALRYE